MAILDTKPERVLFGEIELEIDRPLRAGLTYSIDTAIVGSEHKHGRKTGPFDKVTLRYALSEGDRRAATVTQTWIISRDALPILPGRGSGPGPADGRPPRPSDAQACRQIGR